MRYVCDTLSVSSNAYCHSATRLVSFFAFRHSVPDSLTTTNGSRQFHHKWRREGKSTESKMLIPVRCFSFHTSGFSATISMDDDDDVRERLSLLVGRPNNRKLYLLPFFLMFSSQEAQCFRFCSHFLPHHPMYTHIHTHTLSYSEAQAPPVSRISFPANVGAVFIGASAVDRQLVCLRVNSPVLHNYTIFLSVHFFGTGKKCSSFRKKQRARVCAVGRGRCGAWQGKDACMCIVNSETRCPVKFLVFVLSAHWGASFFFAFAL